MSTVTMSSVRSIRDTRPLIEFTRGVFAESCTLRKTSIDAARTSPAAAGDESGVMRMRSPISRFSTRYRSLR